VRGEGGGALEVPDVVGLAHDLGRRERADARDGEQMT
jgi:hypothetical protein